MTVFYRLYGEAGDLPILTMHGANYFDSYDWAGVAAGLFRNRQVATMDMRGFGESDWSQSKDYSTDARIEDAALIANHLGWPRIIPTVNSMSGSIGIVMAARNRRASPMMLSAPRRRCAWKMGAISSNAIPISATQCRSAAGGCRN